MIVVVFFIGVFCGGVAVLWCLRDTLDREVIIVKDAEDPECTRFYCQRCSELVPRNHAHSYRDEKTGFAISVYDGEALTKSRSFWRASDTTNDISAADDQAKSKAKGFVNRMPAHLEKPVIENCTIHGTAKGIEFYDNGDSK